MKTSDILNLDCRIDKNKEIIQKALRKIKPFSNYNMSEDIPLIKLELLVSKYEHKYPIRINYIEPLFIPGEINMFRANVTNLNTGERMKSIYGSNLYELFSKLCIYFFYIVSKGEI